MMETLFNISSVQSGQAQRQSSCWALIIMLVMVGERTGGFCPIIVRDQLIISSLAGLF